MATSSQQHCFVCGLSNVASESQPRRRYAELTTIFKTLVMTGSFRDTIPADYLATNVETCAVCLTTIKEVFALRQEIVALQTELDGLLVTARKKLTSNPRIVSRRGRKRLNSLQPCTNQPPPPEEEEEVFFQIKEEFPDLPDFSEIIPESFEIEPSLKTPTKNDEQEQELDYFSPESQFDETGSDYSPETGNNEALICSKCGKVFRCRQHLIRHEVEVCKIPFDQSRTNIKFHSCHECDRHFSSKTHLARHLHRIHNLEIPLTTHETEKDPTNLSCSKCGKTFTTRPHVIRHEVEVCKLPVPVDPNLTRLKFHPCDQCDRKYTSKTQLARHINSFHNLDEEASESGLDSSQGSSLLPPKLDSDINHVPDSVPISPQIPHPLGNSHPCSKCGKVLSKYSLRISHEVTVCKIPYTDADLARMGLRFHRCDQCERQFINKNDLVKHTNMHNGLKPYQCEACGKSYSQSSQLSTHRKMHCNTSKNMKKQKLQKNMLKY
ncbi:zinc finger protein 530 [Folsomia candida]|uniref:zinc finger protein 530 n=1 Tax=Folsomia candida TaxID=158441 RepID=UPI000B8F1F61|nr:zinc finger protein 530 [Folsomia candida]